MQNPKYQCNFLIILSALYITFMLCSIVLVHKIIMIGSILTAAGVLVFPVAFVISDIVAEVYGYKVSKQLLWSAIICELVFSMLCYFLIQIKSPSYWHHQEGYDYILGGLLRVYFSGLISYLIGAYINIRLISKWKLLAGGKYFWLRSVGSTAIGEAIYTLICVFLIYIGAMPFKHVLILMASIYGITLLYVILLATPATFLVAILKKAEGLDVYDYETVDLLRSFKLNERT